MAATITPPVSEKDLEDVVFVGGPMHGGVKRMRKPLSEMPYGFWPDGPLACQYVVQPFDLFTHQYRVALCSTSKLDEFQVAATVIKAKASPIKDLLA